jgi:hypothetical protein
MSEAPPPDEIIWENLYVGSLSKFFRRLISIIITLIVLVGCKEKTKT